jgi:ATP-binding cassette subfamily C protein
MTFDDSIRQNLLAGSDAAHSDLELWGGLDLVGLADRVRVLPEGLDAQVGDRGSSLSGGERQRLAIARALLRTPSLLILDEATNALDPDSEEQVIRRLRAIEPRPAALVIAHRQRPLDLCDRVVRMDDGRLS